MHALKGAILGIVLSQVHSCATAVNAVVSFALEPPPANFALVSELLLLAPVLCPGVYSKISLLRESPSTHSAQVGLYPCVSPHVTLQLTGLVEHGATDGACVLCAEDGLFVLTSLLFGDCTSCRERL